MKIAQFLGADITTQLLWEYIKSIFRRKPNKPSYEYGVPYDDGYGHTVITYRSTTPLWDDGVLMLDDGSSITFEATNGSIAALNVGTVNINGREHG